MARDRHRLEHHAIYRNYEIAVVVSPMGFRCGYARVPQSHPWFGLEECDSVRGKRARLQVTHGRLLPEWDNIDRDDQLSYRIEVHGGVTCTGKIGVERLTDWWVIGFDCGHYMDGQDEALMSPAHLKIYREYPTGDGYPPRSREYVIEECRRLVDQLVVGARDFNGLRERLRWIPRMLQGGRERTMGRPRVVLWGARRLEVQYGGENDFGKLTVFKNGVIG